MGPANPTLKTGAPSTGGLRPAREPVVMAAVTDHAERLPFGRISPRQIVVLVVASAVMVAGLVVLAPALADLPDVWSKLSTGHLGWLTLALGLEALSFVGHAILFRAVSLDADGDNSRIGFRASTEITLAGHAATRLFASGGAGGIALTAWALKKSGMEARDVAARMTTFMVLLYAVYMGALLFGGLGLYIGVIPGGGSFALTVVPAILGGVVIAIVASAQLVQPGAGRVRKVLAPIGRGVRDARRLVVKGNLGLLGAIMWWAFDIATLWASFKAFGASPPIGVLVVGYFVGTLANLLPLPGGVGGVDGGMIGAFVAFGVDPAAAIVAVLAYRFFAFWLPIAPGAVSFASLRRTVGKWEAEDAGETLAAPKRTRAGAQTQRALCHQYS
jgi:uncharacterized membrane protein YbhN (UPF0104 family)